MIQSIIFPMLSHCWVICALSAGMFTCLKICQKYWLMTRFNFLPNFLNRWVRVFLVISVFLDLSIREMFLYSMFPLSRTCQNWVGRLVKKKKNIIIYIYMYYYVSIIMYVLLYIVIPNIIQYTIEVLDMLLIILYIFLTCSS